MAGLSLLDILSPWPPASLSFLSYPLISLPLISLTLSLERVGSRPPLSLAARAAAAAGAGRRRRCGTRGPPPLRVWYIDQALVAYSGPPYIDQALESC